MNSILTELYYQFNPTAPSPEYQAAQKRLSDSLDRVGEVFPKNFTEELEDAAFRLAELDARESFSHGLRLGLVLARELSAL